MLQFLQTESKNIRYIKRCKPVKSYQKYNTFTHSFYYLLHEGSAK